MPGPRVTGRSATGIEDPDRSGGWPMQDRRAFLTGGGAALTLTWAAPALAAAITVSPAGLIFVTVAANGGTGKALVDTGSVRGLQLSEPFAKALGLTLADTGQQTQRYQGGPRAVLGARVDSFAYGGVTVTAVDATVSPGDIEAIGGQIGESFDAILGWPLRSKRAFVIDYPAKDLTVREDKGAGLLLPLEAGKLLPVVAGTLGGQPVTFLIDTGAPWCNVDVSLAGGATAGSKIELSFEVGGKDFTSPFRVKDLGAMSRRLGAHAVIGHRFLEQFRFAWDPDGHVIRLA